ncbi:MULTISPECIES: hypothetical protein [Bacillus cereus group]|uniref:Uncharacterized protein n=1 Tax=Bacillus mycoides TaxID=1405 RepID=A0AAP8GVJ9_BACMY|nr:hypothetical protein [Bacillus mycoides]PJN52121.1 hypothetical protein BAWEI_59330 [Bacillus mycoides]PJN69444.1 hypothetical protein BACWE_37220 [Bacillus mycoides]QWI41399.1 hypothetical protein EXW43_31005 [Bacillus mycoides]
MAYDLELEIKEVLEKIDFVERYKALAEKFSDRENTFENYENEKAIEVFESLGYKARYFNIASLALQTSAQLSISHFLKLPFRFIFYMFN